MQTVLGAGGQIAEELTRDLHRSYTTDIRLVSRHPKALHKTDEVFPADLTDAAATRAAVQGSEVAYFTAGLPMDSAAWKAKFPPMVTNVIAACRAEDVPLVFFDNTHMYPQTSTPQTEATLFQPHGPKGRVRAQLVRILEDSGIQYTICRAPEFYGPGKTQSITNSFVFNRIRKGKTALVPLSKDTRRSIIWTPMPAAGSRSSATPRTPGGAPGTCPPTPSTPRTGSLSTPPHAPSHAPCARSRYPSGS